jgi:glycosyltransferase involved in cell wall biosynthesis
MHSPLLSICIPTYQRADSLKETLNSIRSQTFEDYEIVIVDNGSTDHTQEVVQAFPDSRIRFFRNDRNIGAAMNHNRCLLEARGTFIKFIHSDDRLLNPSALATMVETAERHPEVGLITCGYRFADSVHQAWASPIDVRRRKGYPAVRESMRVHNIGLPSEWFFHRKLLASTGFLIDSHICDCDFVMKSLYYYDSYSIAELFIEHRLDGGNETSIASRLNGWEAMRFKALAGLPFYSELTPAMKAGISNYLHVSVMSRVLSGIWNEAYHLCVQGVLDILKLDPHLPYFEGEDRFKLLTHLLDLLTHRAAPKQIYDFVFHQSFSRPIADVFRYGYGFRYELYHLHQKLQTSGKQLAIHGKTNHTNHLLYTIPELQGCIRIIIDDLDLAEGQEGEELAVFGDQIVFDRRDTFLLLAGSWDRIHAMRYLLMKKGWIEGEHYLPVLEMV